MPNLMLHFVIFCLFVSLAAYLLLAGADFGAGILELFSHPQKRHHLQHVVYRAIGPVWEANHIWLILAVVILFVGFPSVHADLTTHLHIPLVLLLLGILFRGAAFVFKHYDAFRDGSQVVYDRIFMFSSLLAPFFLGTVAGAVLAGGLSPEGETFRDLYIANWLNPFAVSVGVLTVALCGFLAAVYLVGEDRDYNHVKRFVRKGQLANLAVVVAGGVSLLLAPDEVQEAFLSGPGGLAVLLASLGFAGLWWLLGRGRYLWARVLAGAQVLTIVGAVVLHQFPAQLAGLDLYEAAAGETVILALGGALIGGLLVIGPALYLLFRVFRSA